MKLKTMKIVLATCLAIFLAQTLGLAYANSAGIISILSVLDTKKSSLSTAYKRVLSTLVALAIAVVSFSILGYSIISFGVYLSIYVPIAYYFELEAGIAPCSVLVSHLLVAQSLSFGALANEVALMIIGAGVAILMNSYMPSRQKKIDYYKAEVEELMRMILLELHEALLNGNVCQDDAILVLLKQAICNGKNEVYHEQANRLFTQTDYDVHYFDMRKQQEKLLEVMMKNINLCSMEVREAKILAGMFYITANQLAEVNPATYLLEDIEQLLNQFRQRSLPQTREEFEKRAILFQLLNDFTNFIQCKVDFYDDYADEKIFTKH